MLNNGFKKKKLVDSKILMNGESVIDTNRMVKTVFVKQMSYENLQGFELTALN